MESGREPPGSSVLGRGEDALDSRHTRAWASQSKDSTWVTGPQPRSAFPNNTRMAANESRVAAACQPAVLAPPP